MPEIRFNVAQPSLVVLGEGRLFFGASSIQRNTGSDVEPVTITFQSPLVSINQPPKGDSPREEAATDKQTHVDLDALSDALRKSVGGRHVDFTPSDRHTFNERTAARALCAIAPGNAEALSAALAACRRFHVPVRVHAQRNGADSPRYAGAVVIHFDRLMNRIWSVDPNTRRARVDAGCSIAALNRAAATHGLTFGPSMTTPLDDGITVGEAIAGDLRGLGRNAAGTVAAFVDQLEVMTYDGSRFVVGETNDRDFERVVHEGGRRGEIYAGIRSFRQENDGVLLEHFYPDVRRLWGSALGSLPAARGGNIARAFVGSEGTLAIIVQATISLVETLDARAYTTFQFPDPADAADNVPFINASEPLLIDAVRAEAARSERPIEGRMTVTFAAADQHTANENADALVEMFRRHADPPAMSGVVSGAPPSIEADSDGCVHIVAPLDALGSVVREVQTAFEKAALRGTIGGHAAAGNIDCSITGPDASVERHRSIANDLALFVARRHGTVSVGVGHGSADEPVPAGSELLDVLERYRAIWDPDGMLGAAGGADAEGRRR